MYDDCFGSGNPDILCDGLREILADPTAHAGREHDFLLLQAVRELEQPMREMDDQWKDADAVASGMADSSGNRAGDSRIDSSPMNGFEGTGSSSRSSRRGRGGNRQRGGRGGAGGQGGGMSNMGPR